MLTKKQLLDYKNLGIVKIDLPEKILKLKNSFLEDSIYFYKYFDDKKNTKNLNKKNFQRYLINLRERNRNLISKYYKISRRFASLKSLTTSREFVNVSKLLMSTKLVSICHFIATRVDFHEEKSDGYITDVHQDFPYIQGSLNGVTFWMPIYSTVSAPEYIPRSHKLGLQMYNEFSKNKKSGTKTLKMVNNIKLGEFKSIKCNANQMLIFDTLLIHRSSQKKDLKPRLSLQIRYDDICKKDMFDKNYPEGLYLGDMFKRNFKNHVI